MDKILLRESWNRTTDVIAMRKDPLLFCCTRLVIAVDSANNPQ